MKKTHERSANKVSSAHKTCMSLNNEIHRLDHLVKRRKVKGQNTAKKKTVPEVRKYCGLGFGCGFFFFFLLSLSLIELHYKNMQCSRDRSL